MQLMLVAATVAMPYPEEAGAPVFAEAAVPADAAPLAEGETVDERHHHNRRPSYGSQGIWRHF